MIQKNWQELIKPTNIGIEHGAIEHTNGKIVAEPLERGFGHTLGNALRRILLSSMPGLTIWETSSPGWSGSGICIFIFFIYR